MARNSERRSGLIDIGFSFLDSRPHLASARQILPTEPKPDDNVMRELALSLSPGAFRDICAQRLCSTQDYLVKTGVLVAMAHTNRHAKPRARYTIGRCV